MDERKALLQAVLDDPEDDLVRLVFADWLEENGEADFAEYIRFEIQYFRYTHDPDRDWDLRPRMERLHSEWRESRPWPSEHLPTWAKNDSRHRGWIEWIGPTISQWVADGESIISCEPVLTLSLRKDPDGADYGSAFHLPCNQRIRELDLFDGGVEEIGLIELAKSIHFERLEKVTFREPQLSRVGFEAFANNAAFSGLRELAIHTGRVREDIARSLADSPHIRLLRRLSLCCDSLDADVFGIIAGSSNFDQLETLWIPSKNAGYSFPGDGGVERLSRSRHLGQLRRLNLRSNRSTDVSADCFARSPVFANLRYLDVMDNPIGYRGLASVLGSQTLAHLDELILRIDRPGDTWEPGMFADTDGLPSLRRLDTGGRALTNSQLSDLMRAPAVGRLRSLALYLSDHNGIEGIRSVCENASSLENLHELIMRFNGGGDCVAAWVARAEWQNLERLILHDTRLSSEGARSLAESPNLHRLHTLDLGWNRIGNDGMLSLLRSDSFPKLRHLDLSYCYIDDFGAKAIFDSDGFDSLAELNLCGNEFGERAKACFREKFGFVVRVL